MKPATLLVEDNEEMLDFVAEDLSKKYHVIKSLNGAEALNVLKEEAVQPSKAIIKPLPASCFLV